MSDLREPVTDSQSTVDSNESQSTQPDPLTLNPPIKTVVGRYRVRTSDIDSNAKLHITDDIDAMIHFYPNGKSTSDPGYVASEVQLIIKSESFNYKDDRIQFIWKCKDHQYPSTNYQ